MSSREAIIGRIHAALAGIPDGERPEDLPIPRSYRRRHAQPGDDITTLFAERVTDYQAAVTRTDRAHLPAAIAAALTARGAGYLALPEGFPIELLPPGDWQWHTEPLDIPALNAVDGTLTLAAAGIAVTGTIVLDTGPGQGRRALTLVPDYHLCIIDADQIAGDVPDTLDRLDPARPLTFISGPSATSDIELDRVEGVHGPRTLHVIIVENS
ncbi:LUD domain-containing protein [Amycolatopsis sp. PS_44_ISF1]|uniref:LutC/YkgG family protein n=1 Tax=Amycolatopsis sp. PS_44_ISF1 TaxID=2974917 RepID=UPI0028DD8E93|nr:LUD domain-containing protein [Amycolatopsis sp. PS_44_ISF1]MDT8913691.1 LUD domain-containing protein [Amycolatopsis sp. PS_44_ISF1]